MSRPSDILVRAINYDDTLARRAEGLRGCGSCADFLVELRGCSIGGDDL